jgi:hypothetical protein
MNDNRSDYDRLRSAGHTAENLYKCANRLTLMCNGGSKRFWIGKRKTIFMMRTILRLAFGVLVLVECMTKVVSLKDHLYNRYIL